jgi:hypothetical protein
MKKAIIQKMSEIIAEGVLGDIGEDNILSIDPDSVDVIVQRTMDEAETMVYEKVLGEINKKLATFHDHMEKWW